MLKWCKKENIVFSLSLLPRLVGKPNYLNLEPVIKAPKTILG